jgi:N6-L-threonylcarbamoyladenine synthase/protein kinase Bud32
LKSEVKLLNDAKSCSVVTPLIFDIDKEEYSIVIEDIDGIVLKDVFDRSEVREIKLFCEKIGENIAKLHNCGIIHGDLTTSNMILLGDDIVFLDFGLGKISDLIEDKGVDILVFKKALYGIHYNVAGECFQSILKGYINANDYDKILAKLKDIEGRGRYIINNSF